MEELKAKYISMILNQTIDEEFINLLIKYNVKIYNLDSVVKKIKLVKMNDKSNGQYDPENKKIIINMQKYDNKKVKACEINDLLTTIFHELEHAKQQIIIDKYEEHKKNKSCKLEQLEFMRMLILDYSNYTTTNETYKLFHDLYPSEHQANYLGFLDTLMFLKKIRIMNNKIEKIMLEMLKKELLKCYDSDLSPFEKLFKEKNNILNYIYNSNLSNYEKLQYGLPVDLKIRNEIENTQYETVEEFEEKMKKI